MQPVGEAPDGAKGYAEIDVRLPGGRGITIRHDNVTFDGGTEFWPRELKAVSVLVEIRNELDSGESRRGR